MRGQEPRLAAVTQPDTATVTQRDTLSIIPAKKERKKNKHHYLLLVPTCSFVHKVLCNGHNRVQNRSTYFKGEEEKLMVQISGFDLKEN